MSDPGPFPPGDQPSEPFRTPPPAPPPPPPNLSPPPYVTPPPGYVAYGDPGSAMSGTFSRIGGVSKALVILLIIFVPLQLLGIVSAFDIRNKARDYLAGEITKKKFEEATQANLGSLASILVIPIAVLTIILMFRMAKNLQALGRTDATWKPGWAIGGWFTPPCAIYAIPWLMFRELWRGSDSEAAPYDPSWKTRPVSPLINVWWVLFGLVPIVGFATAGGFFYGSLSNGFDAEDVAQRLDDYFVVNILLAVVQAVAAVVYLVFLRQLVARHMRATREA
ncbi:MAG: DUF4328 domain-containing protein [Ilumatobacteraceae bacterium]